MSGEYNVMKTMTIREVPDAVYEVIRAGAAAHRRSIQEEVRFILDKEAHLRRGAASDAARRWRERLEGRPLGNSVADIRAGRERA
jgi:plasmid stability protein